VPPLKRPGWIALLVLGVLLAASIPLVIGQGSRLAAFLVDPLAANALPAPPTLRLDAPADGEGVALHVTLAGDARAAPGQTVHDVELRVDGGRWESLPDVVRGAPEVPFLAPLDLDAGDHLLEVRAWDGDSFSLPARALVRAAPDAPPTARIAAPPDGAGLPAGPTEVAGLALNATSVEVRVGDRTIPATLVGSAWRASVDLPAGLTRLVAIAHRDDATSLPALSDVAAGATPPPTLAIQAPQPGDAFGSAGDPSCPGPCILARGVVSPSTARVLVSLDDAPPVSAPAHGGAWTWQVQVDGLLSGTHVVRATPVDGAGQQGAPRESAFAVRTPRSAGIAGDEAPRPTGTPLSFSLAPADPDAHWTLDGVDVARGATAQVALASPGGHALRVLAHDDHGRAATLDASLVALNRAPIAALHVDAGLAVADTSFRADASDADGRVVRYAWQFGDGATASGASPSVAHRYAQEGLYRANLTVYDDRGAASPVASALVAIANAPPVARLRLAPAAPTLLDEVSFEDDSFDPEGQLVARHWDFGDGAASADASPTHRFVARGPHVVSLTVQDAPGATATATQLVDVQDVAPTPAFTWAPLAPRAGEPVGFLDLSRKPDGDIVNWSWSFGAWGRDVAHAFPAPGAYDVTLTITDDWGLSANLTRQILVGDAAPQVRAILAAPADPRALEPVSFRAVGNDAMGGIASLAWDFGDGTNATGLEPTHAYARAGDYVVSLVARNAAGATAEANTTLRIANVPPQANLTAPTGVSGWPLTLVADASRDPDGRLARYQFDADGDGLPDCDGAATRCTFVYPAPGVYAAKLTVLDDEGATATAQLAIQVDPAPPSLAPPTIAIGKPLPSDPLRGSVALLGHAEGPRNLTRVEVQLRSGTRTYALGPSPWMPAQGLANWRLLLDSTAFPDGDYRLVARVVDEAGAEGLASVPITIANGAQDQALVLTVANAPLDPVGADYDLQGSAYHPQNVTAVRWRLDAGPWQDVVGQPIAFTVPLRGMTPGLHVALVDAYHGIDAKKEARVEIQVARPPPALVVDEPPAPIAYGLVHAAGRLADNGTVEWRLDAGTWTPLNASGGEWRLDATTRDLPAGHHDVALRAVGPEGAASEARGWSVRIVRPLGDSRFSGWGTDGTPPPASPHDAPMPVLAPLAALALAALGTRGDLRRRL
jgi:PKD repeat protein